MSHFSGYAVHVYLRAGICLLTLVSFVCEASAEIRITLTNGRWILADEFSEDSTAQVAVVKSTRPGINVTRRVAWDSIAEATWDGHRYHGTDLRLRVLGNKSDEQSADLKIEMVRDALPGNTSHLQYAAYNSRLSPPAPPRLSYPEQTTCLPCLDDGLCGRGIVVGVRDDPLSAYPAMESQYFPNGVPLSERWFAVDLFRAKTAQAALGPSVIPMPSLPAPPPRPAMPGSGAVQPASRIQAAAVPFSANGLADIDSLLLQFSVTDSLGNEVPVSPNTTLRATLWGQRQKLVRAYGTQFFGDASRVEQIATWSQSLPVDSIANQRIVLPLPYPLPEHDIRRYPIADLHVELTVPGRGVFETSQTGIPLKQFSPVRDRLLVETGSPFLPQQLTTGGRQFIGPAFDARSVLDRVNNDRRNN